MMETKVSISCEVKYHLIGFDGISGHYTPKDFERVYDSHSLKRSVRLL